MILRLEVNPGICGVPVFWGISSPLVKEAAETMKVPGGSLIDGTKWRADGSLTPAPNGHLNPKETLRGVI